MLTETQVRSPAPAQRAYSPTAPQQLRVFPGARSLDHTNPRFYMGSIAGSRKARQRKGSLVCPLDIDPLAFSWPVKDLSIVVVGEIERQAAQVRFTQALLRDGAALVVNLYCDDKTITYHRKGVA